jgi:hypothetical protein
MGEEWRGIVAFAVLFSLIVSICRFFIIERHTKNLAQCPFVMVMSYLSFHSTDSYKWEEDMDLDSSDYEGAVL